MAQPYLDELRTLVVAIDGGSSLVCKHFFSGAALYWKGAICASLTPKGLALKLPPARCDELFAQHKAIPLQYFDRSPIKKGYILLPEFRSHPNTDITAYVKECIEYAKSRQP